MKGLSARFCGHYLLDACSPRVLGGIGVYLNAGFLNRLRVWRQVKHPLTNAACDIETVDHIHVRHLSLAVGARVHLRLGRVVVNARSRSSGLARLATTHGSEA